MAKVGVFRGKFAAIKGYYNQKRSHWAFPILTVTFGVVFSMIVGYFLPKVGTFCLEVFILCFIIIFVPWPWLLDKGDQLLDKVSTIKGQVTKWLCSLGYIPNYQVAPSLRLHPKLPKRRLVGYILLLVIYIPIAVISFDRIAGIFPPTLSRQEITDLEQKAGAINPYTQLIRTASAQVDIFVKSDEAINNALDIDRGGYLIFAKGNEDMLDFSATSGSRNQMGGNTVRYRGKFDMDATSNATKQPVSFLNQAEYVLIGFALIPKDAQILGGIAIITINDAVRFEIPVPPQQLSGPPAVKDTQGQIFVRDVQRYLSDIKE